VQCCQSLNVLRPPEAPNPAYRAVSTKPGNSNFMGGVTGKRGFTAGANLLA
jgi:hypothetical protein